jgi:SAM-dependent methyltransferase
MTRLAYYAALPAASAWSAAWENEDPHALARGLRHGFLERLVRAALPPPIVAGRVLDAGCGVGAWVALLRYYGYDAEGADNNPMAVRQAQRAGLPVYTSLLEWLPDTTGSVGVYLSLGVVEHDVRGPHRWLWEAARVLRPGGLLILSVPYQNWLRRIAAPWLSWWQRRRRLAGWSFYQYTFSQRDVVREVESAGFAVSSCHPYGPTKMFRVCLSARRRAAVDRATALGHQSRLRRLIKRCLYTPLGLRCCGHMLLVVATRRAP